LKKYNIYGSGHSLLMEHHKYVTHQYAILSTPVLINGPLVNKINDATLRRLVGSEECDAEDLKK
jgi:hypothetical protein